MFFLFLVRLFSIVSLAWCVSSLQEARAAVVIAYGIIQKRRLFSKLVLSRRRGNRKWVLTGPDIFFSAAPSTVLRVFPNVNLGCHCRRAGSVQHHLVPCFLVMSVMSRSEASSFGSSSDPPRLSYNESPHYFSPKKSALKGNERDIFAGKFLSHEASIGVQSRSKREKLLKKMGQTGLDERSLTPWLGTKI